MFVVSRTDRLWQLKRGSRKTNGARLGQWKSHAVQNRGVPSSNLGAGTILHRSEYECGSLDQPAESHGRGPW